ncbi:MAG: SDR family NAD(P)-dependent oxidoreductase [Hyphomicrobium sp.]
MGRLDGRVAIVTGGAKGIGKVYSEALAREGARVAIADIADGQALAAEIDTIHGQDRAKAWTFDVSREDDVRRVIDDVRGQFGKIDILVNNAAVFSTLVFRL